MANKSQRNIFIDRILIVGFGSIGQLHFKIATKLYPNAVIKIYTNNFSGLTQISEQNRITSLKEALEFSPQLTVISNPSSKHIKTALPFANIGSHLLIEKPISNNKNNIDNLINTCRRLKTKAIVGYNLRFLPSLAYFKKVIDSGLAGEIYTLNIEVGQNLQNWRPEIDYRKSVSAQKKLGGGVLLELSHEIDYLQWIFGEVKWTQSSLGRLSNLEVDVEDSAHIIMKIKSPLQKKQIFASLHLDFIRHDHTRLCTAIGESGTIKWDGVQNSVNFYDPKAKKWITLYKDSPIRETSYIGLWENLSNAIKEDLPTFITLRDGLKTLNIIESTKFASKNGRKIKVFHPKKR